MILYPSIHIKDGVVARLTRSGNDWRDVEVLHTNPPESALQFEKQLFPWLHVVDLNGAFEGKTPNTACLESILKVIKIPMQLSGGIRDVETVGRWLDKGVARVVLTTAAVENPNLIKEACHLFPGRIAVKIDSRNGFVATTGWTETSTQRALDLALRMEEAGVSAIIHADINPDGALSEVNVEAIVDLAFALTVPVIASGGIQSLQEIAELKSHAHAGIEGLILGRALYNGKIRAHEALKLVAA